MNNQSKATQKKLFSIGIPTYNRCRLLAQSLGSALNQLTTEIEVIICDNASSDGTQTYCESLRDPRVRYYRNEKNLGPTSNWRRCLQLAEGEYFSWLQDDDLIFPDFTLRARNAMETCGADAYLATSIQATEPTMMYRDRLYAPPIAMDWGSTQATQVTNDLVIPLSLFCTIAIPPTIAFKTRFLRDIFSALETPNMFLFSERLLIVEAAERGKTIVAPHIAGIFRLHDQQTHKQVISSEGIEPQWSNFVEHLSEIANLKQLNLSTFQNYVETLPDSILQSFATANYPCNRETDFYKDSQKIVKNQFRNRDLENPRSIAPRSLFKKLFSRHLPKKIISIVLPTFYKTPQAEKQNTTLSK